MKQKNTFVCFLHSFQKRSSEQLAPCLVFQRLIHLMTKSIKEEMLSNEEDRHLSSEMLSEEQKRVIEYRVRLITLVALTNKYCLLGARVG